MKVTRKDGKKRVVLEPGEYHVTKQDIIMSTILGSCVSACLYDPFQKIIGMNHFLLSNRRYARHLPVCVTEAGRYGIHAMELLINKMLLSGAERKNLHAKVFGGGNMFESRGNDNFFCVGDVNSRFVREFLANEGIRVVSADLGGDNGRVIHFHHDGFNVYVKKIKRTNSATIGEREKLYWVRKIEEQEKTEIKPDIWG